jgi:imidazoleglycerol-phosphate dehydratase
LAEALGDRAGIARFGDASVPLDESRATVALDCGGRSYALLELPLQGPTIGSLPATLVPHFLETFAQRGGLTLHVTAIGRDDHHLAEATVKALARALRQAVSTLSAVATSWRLRWTSSEASCSSGSKAATQSSTSTV